MTYIVALFLSIAAQGSDCRTAASKAITKQYPGKNFLSESEGRAHYAYQVEVYLCEIGKAKKLMAQANWRKACPKIQARNRAHCISQWMKRHPVGSGIGLLKVTEVIRAASRHDREEYVGQGKVLTRPDLFRVQEAKNLAFVVKTFELENFYYASLKGDSEANQSLIRNEEIPLKMALKQMVVTAEKMNKVLTKQLAKSEIPDQATRKWIHKSVNQIAETLETHKDRSIEWRLGDD